jgi:hypothetical protein
MAVGSASLIDYKHHHLEIDNKMSELQGNLFMIIITASRDFI